MKTGILTTALLTGACLIPGTSDAATPKAVAWQVKQLANKNLKFSNSSLRVVRAVCASRGGTQYVCKAQFRDGSWFYWRTVTYDRDGLTVSGGHF